MLIPICLLCSLSPTPAEALDGITVQEGYTKALIAAEPNVMDPVAFCFDDQGNIYVAESFRQENAVPDNRSSSFWLLDDIASQTVEDRLAMYEFWADQRVGGMEFYSEFEERVRKLQDNNGDGVFETNVVFADGFNEPLDGTGAGLLSIEDELWYTMIPSLIRLQDQDGDGWAETQERVFDGFGVRVALRGHDMHGLAIGLDGRLYWSIGDRGYHLEFDDGRVFHSPGEGAVFRCELDGSDISVFHHGLRNPQELAFDQFGNLFTGDNNSDAGDLARLVYCVEGGETGWRMEYQTLEGENKRGPWVQENGWDPHADDRPAWILPAIDTLASGPSGLVYYPGGGLEERYDDHFFLCDFRGGASYSRVLAFAVEPQGASFIKVDEHPFVEGVLCTDVDFGYDGRMVISDWGEGWVGNEEGRLFAVWDEAHVQEGDVSQLFKDGFKHRSTEELISLLTHRDRRVRIRSQLILAHRDVAKEIVGALDAQHRLQKIHLMWTISMMHRFGRSHLESIAALLDAEDDEIRAQACKILGESGDIRWFDSVAALIDDPAPRVSYFATIASGHLGNPTDEVIAMVEANDNDDVYLRHAGVVALAESSYPSSLANLASHKSPAVRLAAVLALRKQASSLLVEFLDDPNQKVAQEAARAIHDVPIVEALPALAATLPIAQGYAWQRRALSASERLGKQANLENVIQFAMDNSRTERMRLLAINILETWMSPPDRERVDGKWWPAKQLLPRSVEALHQFMPSLLDQASGETLLQMIKVAQMHNVPLPVALSESLLKDAAQPVKLRVHCLNSLGTNEAVQYGLSQPEWELRSAARILKLERADEDAVQALLAAVNDEVLPAQQAAIRALKDNEAALATFDVETLPDGLKLDYAETVQNIEILGDPLLGNWLLEGGDVTAGKTVALQHSGVQCIRCHVVNNRGGISGPSLNGVGSRLSKTELLESLLLPSATVVDGFGPYSAMPPMGTRLSNVELRNLIAYLKTLG